MNGSNLFGRIVKAAMIVALYAFFFIGAVVLITGFPVGVCYRAIRRPAAILLDVLVTVTAQFRPARIKTARASTGVIACPARKPDDT